MDPSQRLISFALGGIGALVGAVVGHLLFLWIARQGFYAVALPGGLAGFGASLLVRHRSIGFAVACGIWALGVGIYSEWKFAPFIADDSFGYFLRNLADLRPITIIMILLGGGLGYYFAQAKPGPSTR